MIQKVFLGECDWFVQKVKAFREIYANLWEFVIETGSGRISLLSY